MTGGRTNPAMRQALIILFRRYPKIIVSFLLIIGFAISYLILWKYMRELPSETLIPNEVDEKADTLTRVSGGNFPDQGDSSDNRDVSRQEIYPSVIDLLDSSNKRQIWGYFRVKGILAYDVEGDSSSATVEDMNSGISQVYHINDSLPDNSVLVDINPDYIILQKDGMRRRIYFDPHGNNARGTYRKASNHAFDGYEKIGDREFNLNPYQVFKGDADKILNFSMKVYDQNGSMEGIQISDLKSNTLASGLGLRENDVLLAVNSKSVNSLLNSAKVFVNAYRSDDLQLKILRGEEIVTLKYHLYWDGEGTWTPLDVLSTKTISSFLASSF